MAKDFKSLLHSLSQQITQQEVEVIVRSTHLPDELVVRPPSFVLECLAEDGKLSARNLEVVMDAMKEIGRNDLCKEVKSFKKKSRKKLLEQESQEHSESDKYSNFDVPEEAALYLRHSLLMMEGSEVVGNKRIEEVYIQARQAVDNLVRIIRHANGLSRTLMRPPSASTSPTSPVNSPPDIPQQSPVQSSGLKRFSLFPSKKAKGKENPKELPRQPTLQRCKYFRKRLD